MLNIDKFSTKQQQTLISISTYRYKSGASALLVSHITCDQVLFSFRSLKHSGGKGETKNRA